MTFFGKENEPEAVAGAKPLRTYTYKTWGGSSREVQAHYVHFNANHVNFWQSRPDSEQDTPILAEANSNVNELKEVTA